jgi:hypothetical protein
MVANKNKTDQIGRGTQLFPPSSWQERKAKALTTFKPHLLEDLVGGKLSDPAGQITAEVILEIRHRDEDHLEQLLRQLGIDPDHPDKWRRAFRELACIHYGVGVIAWRQSRGSNRHAAKWNNEYDLNFHLMMVEGMNSGLTATDALREIARDPEKWGKLPPQRENFRSEKSDFERRFATLKKRWLIVQSTSLLEKALGRAFGLSSERTFSEQIPPCPPGPEGKI